MPHQKVVAAAATIVILVLFRLVPHPPNFTPVLAAGLVSGMIFGRGPRAWWIPLAAMLVSDLIIGMHAAALFVYAGVISAAVIGGWLLRQGVGGASLVGSSLVASTAFFLISNVGVWMSSNLYPHTFAGLVTCFVAALPFFVNTLGSTLLYTFAAVLSFRTLERRVLAR